MWDLLLHFGGAVAIAILICGAALSYFILNEVIGAEASLVIGIILSAYPAYLAFRKLEM